MADDDFDSLMDDAVQPIAKAPSSSSSSSQLPLWRVANASLSLDDELASIDTDQLVAERSMNQYRQSYIKSLAQTLAPLHKLILELLSYVAEIAEDNHSKIPPSQASHSHGKTMGVMGAPATVPSKMGVANRAQLRADHYQPLVETLAEMAPIMVQAGVTTWNRWLIDMGPSSACIWYDDDRWTYRQIPLLLWTHIIGDRVYRPSIPLLTPENDATFINMWLLHMCEHRYYLQHVFTQRLMAASASLAALFARPSMSYMSVATLAPPSSTTSSSMTSVTSTPMMIPSIQSTLQQQ
jgi:hypothetical protein